VFLIFAVALRAQDQQFGTVVVVVVWALAIIFIALLLLLLSSAFFNWPLKLRTYLERQIDVESRDRSTLPGEAAVTVEPFANRFVAERQWPLTGSGFTPGMALEIRVAAVLGGERHEESQPTGRLLRSGKDNWRYEWVEFSAGGPH